MSEQIRPSWRIRPFEMSDYEAVLDLWRYAGGGVTLRPSDSREEIAKKLTRDPGLFLVAEIDGGVMGVIMGAWDGRRGWLHHLTVAEGFRNRGVATALVGQVEEALKARGCLKVNLLVRESNHAARQLYRHLGYAEMSEFLPMGKEF